jgi:hypothetical protein
MGVDILNLACGRPKVVSSVYRGEKIRPELNSTIYLACNAEEKSRGVIFDCE